MNEQETPFQRQVRMLHSDDPGERLEALMVQSVQHLEKIRGYLYFFVAVTVLSIAAGAALWILATWSTESGY